MGPRSKGARRISPAGLALLLAGMLSGLATSPVTAQPRFTPVPGDYYRILDIPIPNDIELEVGGLAVLPNGHLAVSTRRGEVWIVENPSEEGQAPAFRRFASGLHEALGLAWKDGALYAAQRGELTRLTDRDGDGVADRYDTFASWPLSGHYHEYSFGPRIAPNGDLFVTANVAFREDGWWRAESRALWRGWTMRIDEAGTIRPWAAGMRSPAGLGIVDGEFFYSDNQGDWMASGFIKHLEEGDWSGHPASLAWTGEADSPLDLEAKDFYDIVDPRFPAPGESPTMLENREDEPLITLADVAERLPATKLPAVWLPHGILGVSTSEILQDDTAGAFGPFAGQVFVGDQGRSSITRVFLEKVNGVYQGAAFPFLEGFASGVLRLAWGREGDLYVGQTNRGWGSTGPAPYALQRVVWTGDVPFEMAAVRAMPDGFEIEFTRPVDPASAASPERYAVTSFTYKHHPVYGSPVVDDRVETVRGVRVSDDGLRVRLAVDQARRHYIHELTVTGVTSADAATPLLHATAYVTLNEIPDGDPLPARYGVARTPERPVAPNDAASVALPDGSDASPASSDGMRPDVVLAIEAVPGLRFSTPELRVGAGQRVRLTFNNPDDMLHNFLLVAPGATDAVGEAALKMGIRGPQSGYVPDMPEVLAHTGLVAPGASETIDFVAPETPGRYEYVCTFPGHYLTMRGVLIVE